MCEHRHQNRVALMLFLSVASLSLGAVRLLGLVASGHQILRGRWACAAIWAALIPCTHGGAVRALHVLAHFTQRPGAVRLLRLVASGDEILRSRWACAAIRTALIPHTHGVAIRALHVLAHVAQRLGAVALLGLVASGDEISRGRWACAAIRTALIPSTEGLAVRALHVLPHVTLHCGSTRCSEVGHGHGSELVSWPTLIGQEDGSRGAIAVEAASIISVFSCRADQSVV